MPSFPTLKLTYFDLPGRAEAARLAFFIAGFPFEDERLSHRAMAERKTEFPYGVLPVLQVDDEVLAESSAIARYAGRLAGLYPTNNPVAALMVDEIMLVVDEFGESFRPWCLMTDPEEKDAEKGRLLTETIPRYLQQIDTRLATMKTFVTFTDDTRLFIHEIWIYQFLHTVLLADWLPFVPKDVHKPFTQWVAIEAKVANHPRVNEWNALQPMRPTTLKLTYFDFGGRAEPIRLAFHLGGIPFQDDRITDPAAFEKLQPTLPFGRVPTLQINDGMTMTQSLAILRYAGTLAGLYPSSSGDALAALRIDELLAVVDQLHNIWYPAFSTEDPEKQRTLQEALVEKTIPQFLGGLDKRVTAWAKPYATGDALTIADLAVYGTMDFLKNSAAKHVPSSVVDSMPALLKIHALVREHPKVAAYYAGRAAAGGDGVEP